jgi:hypothetical protein
VRCWLVLLVTSCGRIDFDARPDALTLADTPPAVQCPAGYLPVLGISQLGTQDFCVMQTEARAWRDTNTNGIFETTELDDDGCDTLACNVDWTSPGYLPVSPLPVLADPWRSVSAAVAKNACRALGPQFDLMSNREWITIARSAELIGANWSGGAPGSGRLVEGHTESSSTVEPIVDPADPYTGTGNDASQLPDLGWEQRRTLVIAPGVEIWDLPGHVQEWVDWTAGGPLDGVPSPCMNGQLPGYSCPGLVDDDFQSTTGTYDSSQGAGLVIGGAGNAVRRGGQISDRTLGLAGIYAFNTNRTQTDVFPATGFRCVFRP